MSIKRPITSLMLTLLLSGLLTAPAVAQSDTKRIWLPMLMQQRVTDIAPSVEARPFAINNQNQITGNLSDAADELHAFIWTPGGGTRDLGSAGSRSEGYAINEQGYVAGYTRPDSGLSHAVLWTPEHGMHDLGTLGGDTSWATGINDQDQVVGTSMTAANPRRDEAFLWDPQTGMRSLGSLGGAYSIAYDINNNGQVVGYSETATGEAQAFIWTEATGMQPLETQDDRAGIAFEINDNGQAVGWAYDRFARRYSFIWSAETGMIDLRTRGCDLNSAESINNRGQVAGDWINERGIVQAAFCHANGPLVVLESLGTGGSATDINDHGNVAGYSFLESIGALRATLWGNS